ncbi:MAG: hypothetical protein K9H26_09235 [Prolixibacteraceae bacterium]|nr:hypothetical protein [Prolixibacteraceae bacterium]
MKRNLLLIIFLLFSVSLLAGTFRGDKFDFDKFKARKVAYITEAIDLTPAEAEVFWPVYNELEKKRFELMQERRKTEEIMEGETKKMSDAEYTELSRKMASFMKSESDLIIEYNEKFLDILPPKKVVELYKAEHSFREELLKEYRHRKDKDRNGGN